MRNHSFAPEKNGGTIQLIEYKNGGNKNWLKKRNGGGETMAAKKQEITFEESFQKLAETAEGLKSESVSLEDSLKYFEEGAKYYNACNEILKNAKQTLLKYDRNTNALEEME